MKVSGALVSWFRRFRGTGFSLSKFRSFMGAAGFRVSSFHGFRRPFGHGFRSILDHFGSILEAFRLHFKAWRPLGRPFWLHWATWVVFEASWAAFWGVLDVLGGPGGRKRSHWVLQGSQNGAKMKPKWDPKVVKIEVQKSMPVFLTFGTHFGRFLG